MNEEKQRIAIAEECGYVLKHCKYHKTTSWHTEGGFCMEEHSLPDYLNDLNAMHEAENTLSLQQIGEYMDLLRPNGVFACASERAESYLRAKGKWEERTCQTEQ